MEELLKALQAATPDEDRINALACDLFITSSGDVNRAQVSEFERFAPCKIFCAERDSFGWLMGGINYNGRKYYFG